MVDCIVFGLRSFMRRAVAAGLVFAAFCLGGGILELTLGVRPLGTPVSRAESLVWLLAGLALLVLFGVAKVIFFSRIKFEDMTTKEEAPTTKSTLSSEGAPSDER